MGAATPELKGKLSLNNSAFQRGLRASQKMAINFGAAVGSRLKSAITSPLTFIAGAIGAAFSFAAFKSGIMGAIESGAELERLSRVTGATVGSLAMLSPVFRNAGVDSSLLSMGLIRMQRAIFNAAKAGYGGQKVFRDLGLNFDTLAKQKPEEQFKAIGSAIAKLPSAAARTGIAMALFGRSGAELLPVFEEIANTDFGALSEKAKILEQNAAQFHRTTVAMKTARVSLDNVFLGTAVVLAPLIEAFAKVISSQNALAFGTKLGEGIRGTIDIMTGAFMHPEKFTDVLSNSMQGVAADFGNMLAGIFVKAGADFTADMTRNFKLFEALAGKLWGEKNVQGRMDDANIEYKKKHDEIFARPDADIFGAKGFYDAAKKGVEPLREAGHAIVEAFLTAPAIAAQKTKGIVSNSSLSNQYTGGVFGASMALGTNAFADWFSAGNHGMQGWGSSQLNGGAYAQSPLLSARERRGFEDAAVAHGDKARDASGFGAFHAIRAGDKKRSQEHSKEMARQKLGVDKSNELLQSLNNKVDGLTADFVN